MHNKVLATFQMAFNEDTADAMKILYVQPDEPITVSENSQCRGWAYVGSANSSESAWCVSLFAALTRRSNIDLSYRGRLVFDRSTKQPKLNCRNWECGVIIQVLEEKNTSSDSTVESGSETEDDTEKQARKEKSTKIKSKGREEDGGLLDVFRGTVPVPMRLPGEKLGSGARKPWYGAFD